MSARKLLVLLVLFSGLAAFMALSIGPAQAYRPAPQNHPPECYPINFVKPGYWGVSCQDQDSNINSVVLDTEANHHLYWDESRVEMIVELGDNALEPFIYWQVCDKFGACVSGSYQ